MELVLALTHRCNLRCTYCYAGEKSDRRMSASVMDRALELAFAHPGPGVQIMPFGGEPLLEPALIDRLAVLAKRLATERGKQLKLGLTTNGTLLTDANLDMLARHGYSVTVSVDGDKNAHDCARVFPDGSGSFEQVRKGIERAVERLGAVKTVSVVHPKNVKRLAESFDFLAGLGIRQLAFNPDYEADWSTADREAYAQAIAALADRAMAHYRAGHDFSVQPLHGKIITHLKGGYCDSDRCAFGCGELAVAPSGNLYPCDRLIGEDGPEQADVRIGHVDTGLDSQRILALREPKDSPSRDCEECALVSRCMWWCGCVNRALTGRVDGVDDLLCEMEQIHVREADRLAANLYAEKNPPFLGRYYLAASAGR